MNSEKSAVIDIKRAKYKVQKFIAKNKMYLFFMLNT